MTWQCASLTELLVSETDWGFENSEDFQEDVNMTINADA